MCYTITKLMYWLISSFHANFGFTAVHGFIAVSCNLMAAFGDVHWVEMIRPQRWAGVSACPPGGKIRLGAARSFNRENQMPWRVRQCIAYTRPGH